MKKLILALVLSIFVLGLGAGSAMADSIMFPWLVKSSTVATLVSVVNTSATTVNDACQPGPRLHYQYYFKTETAPGANLTGSCDVQSFYRRTSMNDIVTFDTSGAISNGAALFNDQPPINLNVTYTPNKFDMTSAISPARAFLIVDNNNSDCFADADTASLYGEALVVQLTQGAAWGYIAFNSRYGGPDYLGEPQLAFVDEADMQGEVLRSPRYYDSANNDDGLETLPVVLLPLSTFKTKIMVTPVNYAFFEHEWNGDATYSGSAPGARTGNSNSRIQFCLDPSATADFPLSSTCATAIGIGNYSGEDCQKDANAVCTQGGMYDNDEGPMDANLQANVVCTGAIDISVPGLLLTQAQVDYLTSAPGGQGWTYIRSMVGSFFTAGQLGQRDVRTESDSIIGKLEYSDSTSGFMLGSTQVGGAVNDFKWLRNSGSLGDFDLDHGTNVVGEENWEW